MSRYTGPKLRKLRALGEDFALGADRAASAKYVKLHRKQPPGMHVKRGNKLTGYGIQLREKQKARVFYHITESHLRNYYKQASAQKGSTDEHLLTALERRLDNVVYRAGFTNSHPASRQLVNHAHLALNGRKVSIPSIQVKPGDIITVRKGTPQSLEKIREIAKENETVSWLKVDPQNLSIEVVNLPTREEIHAPFNEKLIVEFYSR